MAPSTREGEVSGNILDLVVSLLINNKIQSIQFMCMVLKGGVWVNLQIKGNLENFTYLHPFPHNQINCNCLETKHANYSQDSRHNYI